jgi:hypothetical protein
LPSLGISRPSFSKKKLLLLGFLFVTLLVIPVTVFLVQQQQNTRSQATPNTTLNFVPSEKPAEVGGKVDFEVWISPGNNQVNFIKLVIGYDGTKLTATTDSFELNTASNLSVIKPLAINDAGNELTLVLSAQNPTKVINQNMKIGTISFTVNEASETPIQIAFNDQSIQIRSINGANQDAFNENVYTKNGATASITTQGATDLTPTITETLTPTPSFSRTIRRSGRAIPSTPEALRLRPRCALVRASTRLAPRSPVASDRPDDP